MIHCPFTALYLDSSSREIEETKLAEANRKGILQADRITIEAMKRTTILAFVVGLSMLAMFLTKPAGLSAQESRSTGEPAPPRLTFAFELRVRVGDPVEVGQVTHGRRRIVPIEGGTIKGPMLNGTVPPGGARLADDPGGRFHRTRHTLHDQDG